MRLFFAVVPDDAARSGLFTLATAMQRDQQLRHAPIKWTSEDLLHVTLAFLGEVKGPGISDVIKVASKPLRCEPVDVELVSVGVFPPSGLARVISLGLSRASGRTLNRLRHALWVRLYILGSYSRPKRYSPHLTVGRVRGGIHVEGLRSAVAKVQLSPVVWKARRLTLFESRLSGSGASYRVLAQLPLSGVL